MNRETTQTFLLLFSSFVFAINNCESLPEPDTLIVAYGNGLSPRLPPLSLIFRRTSNDVFTIPKSRERRVKNFEEVPPENSVSIRQNVGQKLSEVFDSNARLDSPLFDGNSNSMEKRRGKRLNKRNGNINRQLSRAKQKKAKELRRLLTPNGSNKIGEEDRDDYEIDQGDDYYEQTSKRRMNWEDYQNEDGASVMELIALNDRHKNHYNDYFH